MSNFQLDSEEVILEEKNVTSDIAKGTLKMTLTSKKLIFEKEKGLIKKELELVDILPLEEVKFFNEEPQIKQKNTAVTVQTVSQNCSITFSNMFEAKAFAEKAKDAVTGTTVVDRCSNMAKGAFNVVDDVLGIDTRETIKGVMQNGIKGALWNGLGRKK